MLILWNFPQRATGYSQQTSHTTHSPADMVLRPTEAAIRCICEGGWLPNGGKADFSDFRFSCANVGFG